MFVLETARTKLRSWMQIRAGDRVLDVGCGAGVDTLNLAKMVGVQGWVEGVDYDLNKVEAAERFVNGMGFSWVHHTLCDAELPLPFPACDFSASCSVRFLEFVLDPTRVLAEMVRVTRPGGWIVVLDTDWSTLSIDMPEADVERRMVRAKTESCYKNGYSARQIYRNFRCLGLVDILIEPFPIFFTSAVSARKILGFDTIEKRARESGLVAVNEIERWRAAVDQADRSGTFFASVCMELVGGRRPPGENYNTRWTPPDPSEERWAQLDDEEI